jgi:crotonobetainyl-CoA:carnitine CoA-transferase CaiB-like acyl-CoA transferase
MRAPLADLRIVAVEQYGAGPFGSLHLADLGADVIKIEEPSTGGDVGRYVSPFAEGTDSLFFETFNRNKRSIVLDITSPSGRRVFEDLVGVSDVVYSNLRGDVPQKLGIRYDDLKEINPRIVCCSLSGFGTEGPRRTQPAYDYVFQASCGWMDLTGEPGGPPTKSGLSLVDYSAGLVAAISMLAAVHAARREGVGADCDVSLYDTAMAMLTYPATWHLNGGFEPVRTRHSAHPSLVPFQAFEAADGWLVAGCAKEKFWTRLVELLGRPDWILDPRFETFAARRENAAELLSRLEEVLRTRKVDEWIADLEAAGIPCGPVNSVAQALEDPHAHARGLIVETEHERFGTVRQVATAVRVGQRSTEHRRAPRLDEHAEEILRDLLGYSAEQVDEHRRSGASDDGTEEPQEGTA